MDAYIDASTSDRAMIRFESPTISINPTKILNQGKVANNTITCPSGSVGLTRQEFYSGITIDPTNDSGICGPPNTKTAIFTNANCSSNNCTCPLGGNLINAVLRNPVGPHPAGTTVGTMCIACPTGTTQISSDFVCMTTPVVADELYPGISNTNLYIGLGIGGGLLLLFLIIIFVIKSRGSNTNYQNYGYNQGYNYNQGGYNY